jgi:hypothetical protein
MANSAKSWAQSAIAKICNFANCELQNLISSRSLLIRAHQKSMSHQTLVLVSKEIKGLNKKCRAILAFHSFFKVDTEKM